MVLVLLTDLQEKYFTVINGTKFQTDLVQQFFSYPMQLLYLVKIKLQTIKPAPTQSKQATTITTGRIADVHKFAYMHKLGKWSIAPNNH